MKGITKLERIDRAVHLNDRAGRAICRGHYDEAANLLSQAAIWAVSKSARKALLDRVKETQRWADEGLREAGAA